MFRLKGIKLYFFSITRLFLLNFKNFYFKSKFYNNKLATFIPNRIFYSPSTYLSASLTNINRDFYNVTKVSPKLLWKISPNQEQKFENLHGFLWLTKLDRKNSKKITKDIINSWINRYFNFDSYAWKMDIMARRIIAWSSNIDITLEDADQNYKDKFFLSLIKQSNFLFKNINNLFYSPNKLICCAAIILSGLMFKENESNYKFGIKELEKIVKNYFDDWGFPKSRNPEEVFVCLKYLILIREWFKEAQKPIPNFLNEIIYKCGSCYSLLSYSNKQFPLFNGAAEINSSDYDLFLKNLKYKFNNKENSVSDIFKIKSKKIEFFIDCGNPPPNKFTKYYQAGCLSFELTSNKQKVICNSGYGRYLSSELTALSRSTAAHSTLYINDTSSCIFQKNKSINKIYGNSLLEKHKIIEKNYTENKDFYFIKSAHNGYENSFGYLHTRSVKIYKSKNEILGEDSLKKTKIYSGPLVYCIRFHIYPDTKIVKTKAGNSILISLSNGEGWLLQSYTGKIEIEKNIFFGNKNKIINNESASISGIIDKDEISLKWQIKKVN